MAKAASRTVSPEMLEQNWRNWSIRTVVGARVLLATVILHCPEAAEEYEMCLECLREMEKKIRENQPQGKKKCAAERAKVKRIWVT